MVIAKTLSNFMSRIRLSLFSANMEQFLERSSSLDSRRIKALDVVMYSNFLIRWRKNFMKIFQSTCKKLILATKSFLMILQILFNLLETQISKKSASTKEDQTKLKTKSAFPRIKNNALALSQCINMIWASRKLSSSKSIKTLHLFSKKEKGHISQDTTAKHLTNRQNNNAWKHVLMKDSFIANRLTIEKALGDALCQGSQLAI